MRIYDKREENVLITKTQKLKFTFFPSFCTGNKILKKKKRACFSCNSLIWAVCTMYVHAHMQNMIQMETSKGSIWYRFTATSPLTSSVREQAGRWLMPCVLFYEDCLLFSDSSRSLVVWFICQMFVLSLWESIWGELLKLTFLSTTY